MEEDIFNSKNPLVKTVAICVVISALVGGVFGFYGASLSGNNGNTFISNITHPGYEDESSAVTAIVQNYSKAVVSIIASENVTTVTQQPDDQFQTFCDDPFFRQFFSDCGDATPTPTPQSTTQNEEVAAGSGFIVSSDGLIITNKHVVNITGATYQVVLSDGTKYPATVVARDSVQDLAIVKIKATNLPTVQFGDSDNLQVGQTVIAIGNALGEFSNTVSKGIISGLARTVTAAEEGTSSETLDEVIQTDAAINPGNSGGPLIDLSGQVIGVNTAIAEGAQSVGFALPINRAKKDVEDYQKTGAITYPFLGVQYEIITPDIQTQNKLTLSQGAWVTKSASSPAVVPGSPAAKAGIQQGDIITSVNGISIDQTHSLSDIIQEQHVGDTVTIKLNRAGTSLTVQAVLTEKQ